MSRISEAEEELREATALALLTSIKAFAETANGAEGLKALAEAYAWVINPSQPHGS